MCTAIAYRGRSFCFGRNMDYEYGFGERIVIMPRNYKLTVSNGEVIFDRFAMIGTAVVDNEYPLYFDAMNEKGLCIAGLNFVGNAVYFGEKAEKYNIAQYELIPMLLAQCASISDLRQLLKKINITNKPFSEQYAPAQLHWLAADKENCIVIESTAEGLKVYDNPIGVLTNNPPFPIQYASLEEYRHLSPKNSKSDDSVCKRDYSRGMGTNGLPGGLSSQARFIRGAFMNTHSELGGACSDVQQVFHILDTVKQVRGCCVTETGELEYTIYSSCCNADEGSYSVVTYGDRQIKEYNLNSVDLSSDGLYIY